LPYYYPAPAQLEAILQIIPIKKNIMRVYGLIGYPVTHSFSKQYFTQKFTDEGITDARYELIALPDINGFLAVVRNTQGLLGLNVTIPHKESVIRFLHILSDEAQEIGAVNVVKINQIKKNLFLEGYNTDHQGFTEALKPHIKQKPERALVLGTGGSAKAVVYALAKLKIQATLVSRTPAINQLSYQDVDAEVIKSHQLIINCTPLGMHKLKSQMPTIPYQALTQKHILFDLIYNPEETEFLKAGKKMGSKTLNGSTMLQIQAERSWEIWNS
jgi:shikimate dehydrogenase